MGKKRNIEQIYSPKKYLQKMVCHCMLLCSRQGKVRLQKFYTTELGDSPKQTLRSTKEVIAQVLSRKPKMCNFIDWQDKKIVYKRYASLFFIVVIDKADNELIQLEQIHRFVEILDQYFGNVCELDIIFNFEKTYLQASSKKPQKETSSVQ